MSDEMITVAARIPLEHYRQLKSMSVYLNAKTNSDLIRCAIEYFIKEHELWITHINKGEHS